MKRRQFITALGCAAALWPLVTNAQQSRQMRRIGALLGGGENDPQIIAGLAAFKKALGERGWIEGRNVQIEYRFVASDPNRLLQGQPSSMNAMAAASVFRSFGGGGSTSCDLDRAHFVVEPVCDNGFSDAVDNFVVIKACVGKPVARLIDGDWGAGSAAVGNEDQNYVQRVIHT